VAVVSAHKKRILTFENGASGGEKSFFEKTIFSQKKACISTLKTLSFYALCKHTIGKSQCQSIGVKKFTKFSL
jgi:hypothetical protein